MELMESLIKCPLCEVTYTEEGASKPVTIVCCGYGSCLKCIQEAQICPGCPSPLTNTRIIDNQMILTQLRKLCIKCHIFIDHNNQLSTRRTCDSCHIMHILQDIDRFKSAMSGLCDIHANIVHMEEVQNIFIQDMEVMIQQLQLLYSETDATIKSEGTANHKDAFEKLKALCMQNYIQRVMNLCTQILNYCGNISQHEAFVTRVEHQHQQLEILNKQLNDANNEVVKLTDIVSQLQQDSKLSRETLEVNDDHQQIPMLKRDLEQSKNDNKQLHEELKILQENYRSYQHKVKIEMDMMTERIKNCEQELTMYKQFNYPQKIGNDRRELKLEGRNVGDKRYLSVTGDNSRILISGGSRDILSCDVRGKNCIRIGESLETEGDVSCVKCCDGNNFVIGTQKGYLIKFVSDGTGRYQRQQISQISCPDDKGVRGLSANSPQFSTWWCVTVDVCYKVGTHNWEVKYKRNEGGDTWMFDIVMRNEMACLLFLDKVRIFNITDDKLQLPSRIIQVGGNQLQIVNDDLVIAGGKSGLSVVNMKSGDVLHKWQMFGYVYEYEVSGVDVDVNNKVIYALTFDNPSCLLCIKCR